MIKLCQDIHQKFGFIIYIKIMEISFCHIRDMQKKKKTKKFLGETHMEKIIEYSKEQCL